MVSVLLQDVTAEVVGVAIEVGVDVLMCLFLASAAWLLLL